MLKALFAIFLFAGLICIVDLEASSPPFYISVDSNPPAANQYNENCAPVSQAILAYAREFFIALGHFIHDFNAEIVASFTVILAIATGYLWKATRDLVRGADDTSKRQLRPYIIVEAKDIQEQTDTFGRFMHKLEVVNRGQTPAYNLRGISRCFMLDHPIPKDFDFDLVMGENQVL